MSDITARERELEREKEAWKVGQNDRTRDKVHLEGQIASLREKRKRLEALIEPTAEILEELHRQATILADKIEDLTVLKTALLQEIKKMDGRLEAIHAETESAQEGQKFTLATLEATLKLESASLREEYAQQQKLLDEKLTATNSELLELQRIRQDTMDSQRLIASGLMQEEVSLRKRIDLATEACEIYESRKQRLEDETLSLQAHHQELTAENMELAKQNALFVQYEDKAWKVLNAKDASLQQRDLAMNERENLRPQASLLPPIES